MNSGMNMAPTVALGLVQVAKLITNNVVCRKCNVLFRYKIAINKQHLKSFHVSPRRETGRDPAPLFFKPEVQQLMNKLTRIDLKKVYRQRKDELTLEPPDYKFMTSEELDMAVKEAEENAQRRLQMPPVVLQRTEIDRVLSNDPALQGYDESKFVFTDITYGVPDRERIVVVRDPDGVLRDASWEERFRMNQIYFPIMGRKLQVPKSFDDENLQRLMDDHNYEFILDRACVQFEPDDLHYIQIVTKVYAHVDDNRKYESLRSTRHFGPFAFHLAWNKQIDNLLLDLIHFDRIDEAVSLIKLYHKLNPEVKSASTLHTEDLVFIKSYIALDCLKQSTLELAIQTYSELLKQKKEVEEGIQRAHGQ